MVFLVLRCSYWSRRLLNKPLIKGGVYDTTCVKWWDWQRYLLFILIHPNRSFRCFLDCLNLIYHIFNSLLTWWLSTWTHFRRKCLFPFCSFWSHSSRVMCFVKHISFPFGALKLILLLLNGNILKITSFWWILRSRWVLMSNKIIKRLLAYLESRILSN